MVRAARMASDIVQWLRANGYNPKAFPPVAMRNAIRATRGYDIRTFEKVRQTLTDMGYLKLKGRGDDETGAVASMSLTEWPA